MKEENKNMDPKINQPEPNLSETISTQPIPSSPKFKLPLVLEMIFLLVVVGGCGILLGKSLNTSQPSAQPTVATLPTQIPTAISDETANWKVYKNTRLGFGFKYPGSLMPCEDGNFTGLISSGPYANPDENQCEVAKNRGYLILFLLNKDDKEFQNFRQENYLNSFSNYKDTEMKIDNKNAEAISGIEKETPLSFKILKIRMGDSFLIIKATGEEQHIAILDQILSTFKFL